MDIIQDVSIFFLNIYFGNSEWYTLILIAAQVLLRQGNETYVPKLDEPPGANYYDNDYNTIYITLHGSDPVDIQVR